MKEISKLLNVRNTHLSKDISELERDGYLIKTRSKKKKKRNTKQLILTETGEETRKYLLHRKDELGLTWEQMRNYKGVM